MSDCLAGHDAGCVPVGRNLLCWLFSKVDHRNLNQVYSLGQLYSFHVTVSLCNGMSMCWRDGFDEMPNQQVVKISAG